MKRMIEITTQAPPPVIIQKQKTIPQIKEKIKKFRFLLRGLPKAQKRYKKISKKMGVDLKDWVSVQKNLSEKDDRKKLVNYLKSLEIVPGKLKEYEDQLKEREKDL